MQPMSFGLSRRSFLASGVALGVAGAARAAGTIKPDAKAALIVTDVQNCFVDGGTLPVKGGARDRADHQQARAGIREHRHHPGLAHAGPCLVRVGATPARSRSRRRSSPTARRCCGPTTASRAPRTQPCSRTSSCRRRELIIRKGYHKDTDSYSAFMEADGKTATGLAGYLKERGIDTLFVTGLATDFCVAWTRGRCAQVRLHDLRDRGCDARHRPQRLAGRGVEADDRRRRETHPIRRHPAGLNGLLRQHAGHDGIRHPGDVPRFHRRPMEACRQGEGRRALPRRWAAGRRGRADHRLRSARRRGRTARGPAGHGNPRPADPAGLHRRPYSLSADAGDRRIRRASACRGCRSGSSRRRSSTRIAPMRATARNGSSTICSRRARRPVRPSPPRHRSPPKSCSTRPVVATCG